jgi:hypothetical protein
MNQTMKLAGGNIAESINIMRRDDHSEMTVIAMDCEHGKKWKNETWNPVCCQVGIATSDGNAKDVLIRKVAGYVDYREAGCRCVWVSIKNGGVYEDWCLHRRNPEDLKFPAVGRYVVYAMRNDI